MDIFETVVSVHSSITDFLLAHLRIETGDGRLPW